MAAEMLAASLAPLCPARVIVGGNGAAVLHGDDCIILSFPSSSSQLFLLHAHREVVAARCPLISLPPRPARLHHVDGLEAVEDPNALLVAIKWVYTARVDNAASTFSENVFVGVRGG